MSQAVTLMEMSDSKGRPLVILRRAPNGEVLTLMMRYRDMTDVDKDAVRGAFAATEGKAVGGEIGAEVGDVERFLAFDEERPCG